MISKILFTVGLIIAVLTLFRKYENYRKMTQEKGAREQPKPQRTQDLLPCPSCGAYKLSSSICECKGGRRG